MKKVFIKTYGCQMNEYDSDKMSDVLNAAEGLVPTDTPEDADVILFNTCSVREKAQEKVFSELGRWRPLKQAKPDLVIGVGGCVASQEGEFLQKRAPYVDLVFGPQTLHRLPQLLDQVRNEKTPAIDVSFPEIEKFDALPEPRAEGPKAFVSIMEGCSKYCTFCVVPYTRGEEVSRPFEDVLTEAADLAQQGVREITLLGQNVNAYGVEFGDRQAFAKLLRSCGEIDGLERVRFTSPHPADFTDDVIGVVTAQQLLMQVTQTGSLSLDHELQAAVFVPETLSGMELLEHFRGSDTQMVFVVDEYGEVQGLVTLDDIIEEMVGEFTTSTPSAEATAGSTSLSGWAEPSTTVGCSTMWKVMERTASGSSAWNSPASPTRWCTTQLTARMVRGSQLA